MCRFIDLRQSPVEWEPLQGSLPIDEAQDQTKRAHVISETMKPDGISSFPAPALAYPKWVHHLDCFSILQASLLVERDDGLD